MVVKMDNPKETCENFNDYQKQQSTTCFNIMLTLDKELRETQRLNTQGKLINTTGNRCGTQLTSIETSNDWEQGKKEQN